MARNCWNPCAGARFSFQCPLGHYSHYRPQTSFLMIFRGGLPPLTFFGFLVDSASAAFLFLSFSGLSSLGEASGPVQGHLFFRGPVGETPKAKFICPKNRKPTFFEVSRRSPFQVGTGFGPMLAVASCFLHQGNFSPGAGMKWYSLTISTS